VNARTRPESSAVLKEKNGLEWWEWRHPVTGVRQIELTGKGLLTEAATEALTAEWIGEDAFEILAEEDVDVYKPRPENILEMLTGVEEDLPEERLLVTFRRGVIPREVAEGASDALREAARPSLNRGNAAGRIDLANFHMDPSRVVMLGGSKVRARYYTVDGDFSNVNVANQTMGGIIGNFNSNPRNPYCRETAYTRDYPEKFAAVVPLIQAVDENFRRLIPSRWKKQRAFIEKNRIDAHGWSIAGTAFTTATVNYNFRTAVHTDAGDLPQGFGNLTVVERGARYRGGYTVFPRFRIAVNVRTGDFLGMDVHEYHGNTEITSEDSTRTDYGRISLVCYCRELMSRCGTREEEERKAEEWASIGTPQERRAKVLAAEKEDRSLEMLLGMEE
jgi:hypothetical protein